MGFNQRRAAFIGKPEIYRHRSATNLRWEHVFDGLAVQVSAMAAAGPNVFYLRSAMPSESAREQHDKLLHELSSRLGAPHVSMVEDGCPWSKWLWGNIGVSLRVAERFTEYVSHMVARGVFEAKRGA